MWSKLWIVCLTTGFLYPFGFTSKNKHHEADSSFCKINPASSLGDWSFTDMQVIVGGILGTSISSKQTGRIYSLLSIRALAWAASCSKLVQHLAAYQCEINITMFDVRFKWKGKLAWFLKPVELAYPALCVGWRTRKGFQKYRNIPYAIINSSCIGFLCSSMDTHWEHGGGGKSFLSGQQVLNQHRVG